MALGRQALTQIDNLQNAIRKNCENMDDCWNTFQYVVNNLHEWADETTIGNESLEKLQKVTRIVQEMISSTRNLNEQLITDFVNRQIEINNGN